MRKGLYAILCAAIAALALVQPVAAQEGRLVRFGLITDVHVCDKPDQSPLISVNAGPRYFTGGLPKLEAFAQAMNKTGAAFVAELGDYTDNPVDGALSPEKKKAASLGYAEAAEAKLALFKGPRYHVFGNHDTDNANKEDFLTKVTNTGVGTATYYSFNSGGVHFVVLDAGFKSDGKPYSGVPGAPGYGYTWDDANIPAAEIAWLKADLAANKLPTVVLAHQLLNPQEQVDKDFDPKHTVRNAAEVRAVLEKSGTVLAVFAGHYHDGGYQQVAGVHYVTLQANAAYGNDASYHNQYATVEVSSEGGSAYRVTVLGNGLQKNYILAGTLR
jgi:alkaline phosphatase